MAGKAPKPVGQTQADGSALTSSLSAELDSAIGSAIDSLSYEQAFAQLETLVDSMEGGALTLEASVAAYERGAALAAHCQKRLQAAEIQVRVLEEGLLKPFSMASATANARASE